LRKSRYAVGRAQQFENYKVIAKWFAYFIFTVPMAETLGSLCDKLCIVMLKQWHTKDRRRINSLKLQEKTLQEEIDEFIRDALNGTIPEQRLKFVANKVYKKKGNTVAAISGDIGTIFSQLAHVNCELWHEVEKSYDIENVPDEQKSVLIKRLAVLNLERNLCMEAIDEKFSHHLLNKTRA
jgi:hypothetical protein